MNFQQDTLKYVKQALGLHLNRAWSDIYIFLANNNDEFRLEELGISQNQASIIDFTLGPPGDERKKISMIYDQTEKGYITFRGLFKCLPYHFKHISLKFIGIVRHLSNSYIPLINALQCLAKQVSIMPTQYIALQEGMLVVFETICEIFGLTIEKSILFEKSLEFTAFILELCKLEYEYLESNEEIEVFSTSCEQSHHPMKNPVRIVRDSSNLYYDLDSIKAMKLKGTLIRGDPIIEHEIKVDGILKRVVYRALLNHRKSIILLKNPQNYSYLNLHELIAILGGDITLRTMEAYCNQNQVTSITSHLEITMRLRKYTLTRLITGRFSYKCWSAAVFWRKS